eukprot:Skav234312  [mRNA]  locus=scaffold1944:190945:195133:- [translate_table: standard]
MKRFAPSEAIFIDLGDAYVGLVMLPVDSDDLLPRWCWVQAEEAKSVLTDYPLTPEEIQLDQHLMGFITSDYTLKSLDEVPQTGNSEYLKERRRWRVYHHVCEPREFPVLGGSGDTVPDVKPRCDPGLGVARTALGVGHQQLEAPAELLRVEATWSWLKHLVARGHPTSPWSLNDYYASIMGYK